MAINVANSIPLYYLFHVLYSGHPSQILRRLWLAHDEAHTSDSNSGHVRQSTSTTLTNTTQSPTDIWKAFDETLKESYRNAGLMASLIATASAALLVLSDVSSHQSIYTLLLASLTCSILSASSAVALLSSASYPDPALIEVIWEQFGLIFVLTLAGPSVWLDYALLCFKISLLAMVWNGSNTSAKIVVTTLIGFRTVMPFPLQILHYGLFDMLVISLGVSDHMNHRLMMPTEDAKEYRRKYRESEWQKLTKTRRGQDSEKIPDAPGDRSRRIAAAGHAEDIIFTTLAYNGPNNDQEIQVS